MSTDSDLEVVAPWRLAPPRLLAQRRSAAVASGATRSPSSALNTSARPAFHLRPSRCPVRHLSKSPTTAGWILFGNLDAPVTNDIALDPPASQARGPTQFHRASITAITGAGAKASRVDALKLKPDTLQSIETIVATDCKPGDGTTPMQPIFGMQFIRLVNNMGADGLR